MSHQDGFGNSRSQPTGSSKPEDGDDRMQKKSENDSHAHDGIKRKELRIHGTCGIRLPQAMMRSEERRLGARLRPRFRIRT